MQADSSRPSTRAPGEGRSPRVRPPPIVAATYALAGAPGTSDYASAYPYAHPDGLFDVTSGSNGGCGAPLCTAGAGWDGPTGLGTPNGLAAFSRVTATSFAPATQWSSGMCLASETCALGDVNGDGKADAIAFTQGGNPSGGPPGTAFVELSTGTGFAGPAEWSSNVCPAGQTCLAGDVDGSGGADAVAFSQGSGSSPGSVSVALSTGPQQPPNAVLVPNVQGLSQDDATGIISGAGLVPHARGQSTCTDPGDVISQHPIGGTEAPRGTTVNITVDTCTGPPK